MSPYSMYEDIVRNFLSPDAEIICLQQHGNQPAILFADVDGDHEQEITAVYRIKTEPYIITLKRSGHNWYRIFEMKGKGIGINDLWAAPISRPDQLSLIVGWQAEWNVSELDIFQWTPQGFHRLIDEGTKYNRIEIEDMPTVYGRDGICELALWSHDIGEAYRVETYRWQPYRLVRAADVNPYYFQRVVSYYEALTRESPDDPLYRTYLNEALQKSGHPFESQSHK